MTEEMFMRLIEMAAAAGEGGFVLVIMYMLIPVFGWILWVSAGVFVVLRVVRAMVESGQYGQFLHDVGNIVDYDWSFDISNNEKRILLNKLKRLKENQK